MKRSKKKRQQRYGKAAHPDAPWAPFQECDVLVDGQGVKRDIPNGFVYLRNNHYTVCVTGCAAKEPYGRVLWLSIKRNDRKVIRDWRDLQRIKNMVVGPEFEAVEIFPKESRLVDTSNQFHLWVFLDGYTFPFGYANRSVMDGDMVGLRPEDRKAQQRAFRHHERPEDIPTAEEMFERISKDPAYDSALVHDLEFVERRAAGE
jgi:hypothetical protein